MNVAKKKVYHKTFIRLENNLTHMSRPLDHRQIVSTSIYTRQTTIAPSGSLYCSVVVDCRYHTEEKLASAIKCVSRCWKAYSRANSYALYVCYSIPCSNKVLLAI